MFSIRPKTSALYAVTATSVDWQARAEALQRKLDALREYACVCSASDLETDAILEIIDSSYARDGDEAQTSKYQVR